MRADELCFSRSATCRGSELTVQSVTGTSGCFAGTSPEDRVYVEWSSVVGENEASFVPKVGERVDLRGPSARRRRIPPTGGRSGARGR